MAKFNCLTLLGFLCIVLVASGLECPSYSKVTTCSPTCIEDSKCSAIGGKCCPNICNAKSCVLPNQLGNSGSNSGYKGSSNSGTGTYCGNVKCNSYEKCQTDRATSRPKCVRA